MPKRIVALCTSLALALGCGPTVITPHLHEAGQPPRSPAAGPLKAHLRSGELVVLHSWRLTDAGRSLEGQGSRYSAMRQPLATGAISLRVDEIALLETESRETVSQLAMLGLSALTLFFGTLSGICLADPKSCFGSCPTFYLEDDPERPRAEGFSASIARSLEAPDVDRLSDARPTAGRLSLWMRNEALETQAVRRVRLLSVPHPPGERVYATRDGAFLGVGPLAAPDACRRPEGDCRAEFARDDGRERISLTDPNDLATREELELSFRDSPRRAAIVIHARQSLLTTFLFYQTLAYMGRSTGEWLAALEQGGAGRSAAVLSMGQLLGGIEVSVAEADGPWTAVGRFDEAGPIAGDAQIIPLPPRRSAGPLRVRLGLAQGHWRIDQVAVAALGASHEARAVELVAVEHAGQADPEALRALLNEERHLVTLPGDAYRLAFVLPPEAEGSELFLESEGYYYEWMRAEWLREEDPAMVALIVDHPEQALRRLAPAFKAQEAGAERTFWNSRFGR
jgi:hypothetical protein